MRLIVIHQHGITGQMAQDEADAIRKQFRDQAREEVPVVILRTGLLAQVIEVDDVTPQIPAAPAAVVAAPAPATPTPAPASVNKRRGA